MNVSLCVRTGDGGTIVAISGEVDVCTEAPLQQALLWIIRERGARLMLDVSGVSFIDCAGLRALLATRRRAEMRGGFMCLIATSAAVRRITELTGTHEALARNGAPRPVPSDSYNERTGCDAPAEVSARQVHREAEIETGQARPQATQTP
jgi:anti-sigma B factor antagonist